jgi:hypothetical protein
VNVGNGISVLGPPLLYANNQIYAQADQLLLVWDAQTMNYAAPFNAPGNGSNVLNP